MAILFGTIFGALFMLTITGVIDVVGILAIGFGLIIGSALIGMQPIAKFTNWRIDRK